MQISGRVALITGGASGLGEATARRFLHEGARLVIADRDQDRGQALATEWGPAARFVPCDVTDETQVQSAVDDAVASFERIDILVNAAGIGGSVRTIGREGPQSMEHFAKIVGVNLLGTFSVLSKTAFCMADNDPDEHGCRGVIVNTASIAAFDGQVGQAAYAASKGGIVSMTLPIARDLSSLGIRCCTICPGIFDTPLLSRLPDEIRAGLEASIPHPSRLGQPDEFAMLVEQIVANPYMNAETIRLDGGLRMAPK